ncbi:hypothetical protein BDV11DRAFT_88393 [Aspergillus similis]
MVVDKSDERSEMEGMEGNESAVIGPSAEESQPGLPGLPGEGINSAYPPLTTRRPAPSVARSRMQGRSEEGAGAEARIGSEITMININTAGQQPVQRKGCIPQFCSSNTVILG